jgi:hypothetical protein
MTPTMMWLTTFKSAVASSRSKLGATRSDVRCRPHTLLAVIYEASCQAAVAMLFPCKTRNRCPKFLCSVIYVLPRPSSCYGQVWSSRSSNKFHSPLAAFVLTSVAVAIFWSPIVPGSHGFLLSSVDGDHLLLLVLKYNTQLEF